MIASGRFGLCCFYSFIHFHFFSLHFSPHILAPNIANIELNVCPLQCLASAIDTVALFSHFLIAHFHYYHQRHDTGVEFTMKLLRHFQVSVNSVDEDEETLANANRHSLTINSAIIPKPVSGCSSRANKKHGRCGGVTLMTERTISDLICWRHFYQPLCFVQPTTYCFVFFFLLSFSASWVSKSEQSVAWVCGQALWRMPAPAQCNYLSLSLLNNLHLFAIWRWKAQMALSAAVYLDLSFLVYSPKVAVEKRCGNGEMTAASGTTHFSSNNF